MTDTRKLTEDYILQVRSRGERVLTTTRLALLIPIGLLAILVTFNSMSQGKSFGELMALGAIPMTYAAIAASGALSVITLGTLKKGRYHPWMPYVFPFIDVTLIGVCVMAFARTDQIGYLWVNGITWFMFMFLALSTLRVSPLSTIVTGAYATAWIAFTFTLAGIETGALSGDPLFANEAGHVIKIQLDDELVKPVAFFLSTLVLAYGAKLFKRSVSEQIEFRVERERKRDEADQALKLASSDLEGSGRTLTDTSNAYTEAVRGMIDASLDIERETSLEFEAIDGSSKAILSMTASIRQVDLSIDRQAELVRASAAAIEEMDGSIRTITQTSGNAEKTAANLVAAAEQGEASVQDAVQGIKRTAEASGQIEEILEIISSIANSTNLLAMNAAIEAAHAGDAGRGFAVVADEIRKLAETTSENTRMIDGILKTIKDSVQSVTALADMADGNLKSILEDARETQAVNEEILRAMREQSATMGEVLSSIQDLETISREVKMASGVQSEGSKAIVASIESLRAISERVTSLAADQKRKGASVAELSSSLRAVVDKNRDTIGTLSHLAETL
jgi:methyl-accepting chemotaxis protein